jgi:hypothetical protein
MQTHLKTTKIFIFLGSIVTLLYFFPSFTLLAFMLFFLYALIYGEVKESEQKKKESLNSNKEDEGEKI